MRANRHNIGDKILTTKLLKSWLSLPKLLCTIVALILVVGAIVFNIQGALGYNVTKQVMSLAEIIKSDEATGYDECDDIVIVNTGLNTSKKIKGSDIETMGVLHFSDEQKKTFFVGMLPNVFVGHSGESEYSTFRKEFSLKDPSNFLNGISSVSGLKTEYYITVNDQTIMDLIDVYYYIRLNIHPKDIEPLNKRQEEIAEELNYRGEIIPITQEGVQDINGLQAVAFSSLDYDGKGDQNRRFRKVVKKLLIQMRNSNFAELELAKKVLLRGNNNLNTDYMIQATSRIQAYSKTDDLRWLKKGYRVKWHGTTYYLPRKSFSKEAKRLFQAMGEKFRVSKEIKMQDRYRIQMLQEREAEIEQKLLEQQLLEKEEQKENQDKETKVEKETIEEETQPEQEQGQGGESSGGQNNQPANEIVPDSGSSEGSSEGDSGSDGEGTIVPDDGGSSDSGGDSGGTDISVE